MACDGARVLLVGHSVFAVDLGLGIKPAILILGMLLMYSLTMGFVYDTLNALQHPIYQVDLT